MTENKSIRWTTEKILALAALVLGVGAVFGNPYGGPKVKLDTEELAWVVEKEVDHVTAEELAARIIRGDVSYRLLDLRDSTAFNTYHIPTAENVVITGLNDHPILRNEEIILYSEGGIHSAQAWMLLRARGYRNVYMILGGFDAWQDDVLFPALAEGASPEEEAAFAARAEVARHFGGAPQTGVADAGSAAPTIELPKPQAGAPVVVRTQRRKKEGC